MQTAVLAVADMAVYNRVLTLTYLTHWSINLLQGRFDFIAGLAFSLVHIGGTPLMGHVGFTPVLLAALDMLAVFMFMRYQKNSQWQALDTPDQQFEHGQIDLSVGEGRASTRKLIYS